MERRQIQILVEGRHRAMTGQVEVDAAMLDDVVATFSDAAPVTAGHVTSDADPALGWVTRVIRAERSVEAEVELADETAAAIRDRRAYRWVSPGLRRDPDAGGRWVLDHLALLGARRPAQRELRALFAGGPDDVVLLEGQPLPGLEEEIRMDVSTTAQSAPQAAAEAAPPSRPDQPQPDVALLASLRSELDQLREQLQAERRARRRLEIERRVAPLLQEGRLAEADVARVVALGEALDQQTVLLSTGQTPALDALLDLLGRLPATVASGRVMTTALLSGDRGAGLEISAPAGCEAAPERLELYRRARGLVAAGRAPDIVAAAALIESGRA